MRSSGASSAWPFKPWRALAAALALATIPLGTGLSALAQLGALVALLGLCLAAEERTLPAEVETAQA